jgi:hypothetical protein
MIKEFLMVVGFWRLQAPRQTAQSGTALTTM